MKPMWLGSVSLLALVGEASASTPLELVSIETQKLIDTVATCSRELGLATDPSTAIRSAGISEELASRLTVTLNALLECHRATASARQALATAADEFGGRLDPAGFVGISACFGPLWHVAGELELHLRSPAAAAEPPVSLDVWPVLRVETGMNEDVYIHDYLLQVDGGGNDTYMNNQGSNVVDLKWGPGAPAANVGPARGCQTALNGFRAGDCSLVGGAVLLDMGGDDTYGVFQPPDVDVLCTRDPVVRRTTTAGAGLAGVGILRDVSGNDHYNGKTGSLGTGHVFGIGILSDAEGNDSYLAVRNSEGFALLGGFGLLHDEAGDDSYDFYMPSPIDPNAPNINETPGAGGVVDDVGNCDKIPRFTQGAANFGQGLGVLLDDQGNDFYRGDMVPTFISSITLAGNMPAASQGFGAGGAAGLFLDRAGTDTYVGVPDRGNGVTVPPGGPSTGEGLFVDQ